MSNIERNKTLDKNQEVYSTGRLASEATGSALIQIGTAVVTTLSTELSLVGIGLDVVGTWLAVRSARKNRDKVVKLENHPPEVPYPRLRMDAENLVLQADEMQPKVEAWREKEQARLDKRIAESKNAEKRDRVKLLVYPTLMGLGRAAILIGAAVPHTGAWGTAVVTAVEAIAANPAVLIPAAMAAFSQPLGWILVGAVVASSFAAAAFSYKFQKQVTNRFETVEKPEINKVAAEYFTKYGDEEKSGLERIAEAGIAAAGGVWRWWQGRRANNSSGPSALQ